MYDELQQLQEMLEQLSALRESGGALAGTLGTLEQTCREERWLTTEQAEESAAALCAFARNQADLLTRASQLLEEPSDNMAGLEEQLAQREAQRLLEQARIQAESENRRMLAQAEAEAAQEAQKLMEQAEQKCEEIKQCARQRLDQAAQLIVEKVVNR